VCWKDRLIEKLSLCDICCPPCCSVTGLIHVLLVLSLSVSLLESLGTSPLSVSLSMRGGESDEVGKKRKRLLESE